MKKKQDITDIFERVANQLRKELDIKIIIDGKEKAGMSVNGIGKGLTETQIIQRARTK